MSLLGPGSTLWLLRHEVRLNLRTAGWARQKGSQQPSPLRGVIIMAVLLAIGAAVCLPLAFLAHRFHLRQSADPLLLGMIGLGMLAAFSLLLSQTLARATDAFYERADLDLLLSSPLSSRKVLTVRSLGLAVSASLFVILLATPFTLAASVLDSPAWLSVYVVVLALGLVAAAVGVMGAMALFALIGPRRTRTIAQVLAAVVGAGFFLTMQARNFLSPQQRTELTARIVTGFEAMGPSRRLLTWPGEALLGHPLPLLALTTLSVGLFLVAVSALGRRFGANAAAAGGAETSRRKLGANAVRGRFGGGPFAAVMRKELRLIWRDPALMSQVMLRVLYLLPLTLGMLRGGSKVPALAGGGFAMPFAAMLCIVAGQIAGSLAFITISAEDSPELIAAAPSPRGLVQRAKLTAALLPTALLMAPALVLIFLQSPLAGLAGLVGWSYCALAAVLTELWHTRPAKRSDFRRRRANGGMISGLAGFVASVLAAGATALASFGSLFCLIPAALSVAVLGLIYLLRPKINDAG